MHARRRYKEPRRLGGDEDGGGGEGVDGDVGGMDSSGQLVHEEETTTVDGYCENWTAIRMTKEKLCPGSLDQDSG